MENSFYQVSEIEISYRPKFKASERPPVQWLTEIHHLWRLLFYTTIERKRNSF